MIMSIRSDRTLEAIVEQAKELCQGAPARDAVVRVLDHVRSGAKVRFRGGRRLVELLGEAAGSLEHDEDPGVGQRLRDSLDYAENRASKHDLEDRYALLGDGRSKSSLKFLSGIMTASATYWQEVATKFLAETPGATGAELLAHLQDLEAEIPFMDAPEDRPGRYRIVRGRAEASAWIASVLADRIDIEDVDAAAKRIVRSPDALALMASDDDGTVLLHAMELKRRREGLGVLRKVVEDPGSFEWDIHRVLREQLWIFGGRFVGEARHRRLVPGDELDIPLLRPDGSLCVVELKRADVRLVKRNRNAWALTDSVHRGVNQALNYLCGLDENRERILAEFLIDTRRANALVLIGHSKFQPDVPKSVIGETLRIQNSHLTRIEVLTYEELLEAAERSLETTR